MADDSYSKSLLQRHESAYIKGILILLIVLGHNNYIMDAPNDGAWLKDWLYSFHVHAYLYLPFLYGIKFFSIGRVKKNFIRLFRPYSFFFVLLLLINTSLTHLFVPLLDIQAFLTGSQLLLRQTIGMEYLWFLPAMFSILLLKELYDTFRIGHIVLYIAIIVQILVAAYIVRGAESCYLPFGLYYALLNFSMAIFFRFLLSKYKFNIKYSFYSFAVFSFGLTLFWFIFHPLKYYYSLFYFFLLPGLIFPTIYFSSKLINPQGIFYQLMVGFGNKSLGIYLISQLIFQFLNIFIQKYFIGNLLVGIISYIITVALSYIILRITNVFLPKFYKLFLS